MENLRIPPHNEEAEQSILGSMMLDREALSIGLSLLSPDSFYRPSNEKIFSAIKGAHEDGNPVDQISVVNELKKAGDLEMAGGAYYITELTEGIPSTANAGYYAKEVADKATLRTVISDLSKIVGVAYDGTQDPARILSKMNDASAKLLSDKSGGYVKLSESSFEALDVVSDRYNRPDAFTGIPTGIIEQDRLIGGLKGGDLIILAARPSMGKTAYALQLVRNVAHDDVPVGVLSLEMTRKQLYLRQLFSEASVDSSLLNSGRMSEEEFKRLLKKSEVLNKLPLYIDDGGDAMASQLKAKAEHFIASKKIKLLIIDYLQLMDESSGDSNRNLELAKITKMFKQLAKKLDIPVIILSQLTKEADGKRPTLKNLRDSGAIEQDADIVIFIWRPEQNNIDIMPDGSNSEGVALIDFAKNRNGQTGEFKLRWIGKHTRFESMFI